MTGDIFERNRYLQDGVAEVTYICTREGSASCPCELQSICEYWRGEQALRNGEKP